MYWPQGHGPSGKVTAVKGSDLTLGDCGRNRPELSDPGTRGPKGDHELGQGHSRATRKQDSEQLFQGRGQAQQEPRTLREQLVSAERD